MAIANSGLFSNSESAIANFVQTELAIALPAIQEVVQAL